MYDIIIIDMMRNYSVIIFPSLFKAASGSAVSFAISEPHLSSFAKPVTPGQYNFARVYLWNNAMRLYISVLRKLKCDNLVGQLTSLYLTLAK